MKPQMNANERELKRKEISPFFLIHLFRVHSRSLAVLIGVIDEL